MDSHNTSVPTERAKTPATGLKKKAADCRDQQLSPRPNALPEPAVLQMPTDKGPPFAEGRFGFCEKPRTVPCLDKKKQPDAFRKAKPRSIRSRVETSSGPAASADPAPPWCSFCLLCLFPSGPIASALLPKRSGWKAHWFTQTRAKFFFFFRKTSELADQMKDVFLGPGNRFQTVIPTLAIS